MTYTSHGHHIPGSERGDEGALRTVARCGGILICSVCQRDMATWALPDTPELEDSPTFFEDTSEYDQNVDRFLKHAKLFAISAYNNRIADDALPLSVDQIYIVWFSKTLQNWKALVSTTVPGDGLYFEITYDGDKAATYVDTYIKVSNDEFSQEGRE